MEEELYQYRSIEGFCIEDHVNALIDKTMVKLLGREASEKSALCTLVKLWIF